MPQKPSEETPYPAGRWLRAFRRHAGLSQRELAAASSVAVSTIAAVEAGRRVPGLVLFERIARSAGLRLVVVDGDGSPLELDDAHDRIRDRGARHFPAHLKWSTLPPYLTVRGPNWWGWEHLRWEVPGTVDLPSHVYWQRLRPPREGEWREHPWWGDYQARARPKPDPTQPDPTAPDPTAPPEIAPETAVGTAVRTTDQSRPSEGPPEPPPA